MSLSTSIAEIIKKKFRDEVFAESVVKNSGPPE